MNKVYFRQSPSHKMSKLFYWVYAACIFLAGVFIITKPIPILLDRVIPDDAFYYLNTAKIFSHTGFSSFDGIHFTNGYQPLWFLISVPVFWLFPNGGEPPLRLLLVLQVLLSVVGILLFIDAISKLTGLIHAIISSLVWIVAFQPLTVNGLETALFTLTFALLFRSYVTYYSEPSGELAPQQLLKLGLVCGFIFLTRTDTVFLIIPLSLALFIRAARTSRAAIISLILHFGVPLALLAGGYLITNLIQTGHLMPVSGAAKIYYSQRSRELAIHQNNGAMLPVYFRNLLWILGFRFVLVGVFGPWVLILLSYFPAFKHALGKIRIFWPFYVGVTFSYLFYSIFFYGGFTTTLWYYVPHILLACFTIAAISSAVDRWPLFRKLPIAAGVVVMGIVVNWIPINRLFYILACLILVGSIFEIVKPREIPVLLKVNIFIMTFLWIVLFTQRGISTSIWIIATFLTLIVVALVNWQENNPVLVQYGALLIVLMTLAVHFVTLSKNLKPLPRNWNFNLYQGALWARDYLHPDTTIWSGSAGILGYFSGRSVVNTDALANDYEFLENILKAGKLDEYYLKWDYTIDAYPDGYIDALFPEGCYISIPPQYAGSEFNFGSSVRKLRVFKMVCSR